MKRITAMLLSLLLGAGLLTVCWRGAEYHREDTERENGVTFYVRRDRQAAFAGNLTWDGQSDTVDYVIPDRVDGAPVTALGGLLYGTAFKKLPCGWGVELPDTFRGAERQQYLLPGGSGTEITLTVRLHIGRYVSYIENVGLLTPVGYYSTEGSYVIRQEWVVTCDPMNQTFYAEGGRLYHRADGTPADICYDTEWWYEEQSG